MKYEIFRKYEDSVGILTGTTQLFGKERDTHLLF